MVTSAAMRTRMRGTGSRGYARDCTTRGVIGA